MNDRQIKPTADRPRKSQTVIILVLGFGALAYFASALLQPTTVPFFGFPTPGSPGFAGGWTYLYTGWILAVGVLGGMFVYSGIEMGLDYHTHYQNTSAFREVGEDDEQDPL